ncbi:MAG: galactokinase [Anaerolineae bacterium]|nr:galactokinase [Anaerolineae bacterium]
MPTLSSARRAIQVAEKSALFVNLYGTHEDKIAAMQRRWLGLIDRFAQDFPGTDEVHLFSTPGRTEVGGNHTDHNAGRVLAAAVNLELIGVAGASGDGMITVHSEGYPEVRIDIHQLEPVVEERFTTASLIRGVCARMQQLGYAIGGFNACLTTDVPKGSGLSSSAAFEVQIGTILNFLFNDGKMDAVQNAMVAQFAENNYFGKPSGLMDQTTCSVGGFVTIDFRDAEHPVVHKVNYDFAHSGYALVIVETGGNHADLTDEYAAVAGDMKSVAAALGGKVLRDVSRERLLANMAEVRGRTSDRAVLRALHFFGDDMRVVDEVQALERGDFHRFLELVKESGRSSWMMLQNCYSTHTPLEQGIPLAQAVSAQLLGEEGAWRVHGGGFAGTIQVFAPAAKVDQFVSAMEAVFGKGSCYPIMVRAAGSVKLEIA